MDDNRPTPHRALFLGCVLVACLFACSETPAGSTKDVAETDAEQDTATLDSDAGGEDVQLDSVPAPVAAEQLSAPRDWRIARGIIHSHTPYSHDACDGEPRGDDDAIKESCLQDFREAVCRTRQDFVFNTDHEETAARVPFESLLLLRDGDETVTVDGRAIANRMDCPNGHRPLIMPGGEFGVMPVGLEQHLDGSSAERESAYNEVSAERVTSFKEAGAVVLQAHTESRDIDTLSQLGLDGFEIYNLHANLDPDIREDYLGLEPGAVFADLIAFIRSDTLPPDLVFLSFLAPNRPSLDAFDTLLARGHRLVGTAGTDSHQNVLDKEMNDGERGDSFRRLMRWFSNYLLVEDASPAAIKDALRSGRGYVVFDILGTPQGFDFRADAGVRVGEVGSAVSVEDSPTLVVEEPTVLGVPADLDVTLRLLRAQEGGAVEVARSDETLRYDVESPGAYRAEVLLRPSYYSDLLGDGYGHLADEQFVWIYTNPIYVE